MKKDSIEVYVNVGTEIAEKLLNTEFDIKDNMIVPHWDKIRQRLPNVVHLACIRYKTDIYLDNG